MPQTKEEIFASFDLRNFSNDEKKRLNEALFYFIVSEIVKQTPASDLPDQTSLPELLGYLTNTAPGAINRAYNILSLDANTPKTFELMIACRELGLPALKMPRTKHTYYKMLSEYRAKGQPELTPKLSTLVHVQISKFLRVYGYVFLGKNSRVVPVAQMLSKGL